VSVFTAQGDRDVSCDFFALSPAAVFQLLFREREPGYSAAHLASMIPVSRDAAIPRPPQLQRPAPGSLVRFVLQNVLLDTKDEVFEELSAFETRFRFMTTFQSRV
jgi:hypothetical protein